MVFLMLGRYAAQGCMVFQVLGRKSTLSHHLQKDIIHSIDKTVKDEKFFTKGVDGFRTSGVCKFYACAR